MAHFHTKKKKGRPYLYVRETARVNGKSKVVSQIYIGSPKRVVELVKGQDQDTKRLKVEEFGALWLACQINNSFNYSAQINSPYFTQINSPVNLLEIKQLKINYVYESINVDRSVYK